jgi:hypothetical protein
MSITNGMGQSMATPDKQRGLSSILQQHFCITRNVIHKHESWAYPEYFYIDAYCGSGHNIDVDEPGSPYVFRNNARLIGLPFTAIFIDEIIANIDQLQSVQWPKEYKFLCGDNSVLVPKLVDIIYNKVKLSSNKKQVFGLIYCDPNVLPDFDMLEYTAKKLRMVDILIRHNTTAGKRIPSKIRVDDVIDRLKKKMWLIRGPIQGDKHQWCFLFGTNYIEYSGWKSRGFHRIDSEEGRRLFRFLNYTEKEKKEMGIDISFKGVT